MDRPPLPGRPPAGLVIYELHVGTFTAEGTFAAVIAHLDELRELGVTAIELMPVAEFPGTRNWGYDGVYLSAAESSYGGPDGLARASSTPPTSAVSPSSSTSSTTTSARRAHRPSRPSGPTSPRSTRRSGARRLNFDDEHCDPVREWVLQSAEHWIRDFHVDGLRLDAIHAIVDSSASPLLAAIADRAKAANPRRS